MSETVSAALELTRWQGDRGTYHLVTFTREAAETLSTHALLHKLEFGRARGFGSIKLTARIGATQWRTSVFPQRKSTSSGGKASGGKASGDKEREWVLLISKKVMRAEGINLGDTIEVTLAL